MNSKKWKVILFFFVFNILFFIGALYVFEWLNHAPHDGLKPTTTGDATQVTWGFVVENNSWGFRDREFSKKKRTGTYRIMVLGDSFSWGVGMKPEDRYSNRLEKKLNAEFPQQHFEVFNFSVCGYSTVDERNQLEKYMDDIRPDRIIVGFCLNDPAPSVNYGPEWSAFTTKYGDALIAIVTFMTKIGLRYTGKFFRDVVYKLAQITGFIPSWVDAIDKMYESEAPEWIALENALRDIKEMSDRINLAPPIFTVLEQGISRTGPTDYENPSKRLKKYLRWYEKVESTAARWGYITQNHRDELTHELKHYTLTVNEFDWHPSVKLHEIYANKLFKTIKTEFKPDKIP